MTATEYPPQTPHSTALAAGEENRHSILVIGYRYFLESRVPERSRFVGHLTTRRFILEPEVADDEHETLILNWNDIIEFEFAAGSVAQDRLDGIDDAMLHCTAKYPLLDTASSLFLFHVCALGMARPGEFDSHGQRFLEIAEDLMLDAFE